MKRGIRRRLWAYGTVVSLTGGFYLYQPVRIDLFPRSAPVPNPNVDPDSKGLFARGARVAVLTAHPDDSEYYAGALLAKLRKTGARVSLVLMTDGDKGYEPWEDAARNRRVRRAEETAAWSGEPVTFLGFPDGRLGLDDETVERAAEALRGADWVVSFDGDYPPKVSTVITGWRARSRSRRRGGQARSGSCGSRPTRRTGPSTSRTSISRTARCLTSTGASGRARRRSGSGERSSKAERRTASGSARNTA